MRIACIILCVLVGVCLADELKSIVPGPEDIGYGSSRYPHIWKVGHVRKSPFIVGKGNNFDHRYRLLARFPLDTLMAKGSVRQASVQFRLALFVGSRKSRVYLVEAVNEDIQKLKANDLTAGNVTLLGKVELSKENVTMPVSVDVTQAVNDALGKVYSALTIRIRPEEEKNDDPGASGAGIKIDSLSLLFR